MANRMKPLLDCLISKTQSVFMPGRMIIDNILLAYKTHHFLKCKRQGREGYAMLKLDMSKVYDPIEWKMLQVVLLKFGFSAKWVDLVMCCVSSVEYSIMAWVEEIGPIRSHRGLRQGDPVSPYLFIMVAKALSALIRDHEMKGFFHGVRIVKRAPTITHLLFAYDSYTFSRQISRRLKFARIFWISM